MRTETYAAEQRAGALARFGAFKDMKETRMASIATLSGGRFDWERMARELSLVLPTGVWLTELKASATGEEPPGGSGGGSSATSTGSASSASSSSTATAAGEEEQVPRILLSGCSPTQEGVAEALVRLRRLHQAQDVELILSEREEQEEGAGTLTGGDPAGGPSAATPEGCGVTRGRSNYKFEVKIKLSPTPDRTMGGGSVPRKLGGGA